MTKQIGILTGGGDCPGWNAVIRSVAKALMHEQGYEKMPIDHPLLDVSRSVDTCFGD